MAKESKESIKKEVESFFNNISKKSQEQVKKIKTKAMSINLKLKEKRKSFCKKCNHAYNEKDKTKITKERKTTVCSNCGKKNFWKIKILRDNKK